MLAWRAVIVPIVNARHMANPRAAPAWPRVGGGLFVLRGGGATGTAGNAVIFGVVRSVLLKPLPIAESSRIVLISNVYPKASPPVTGPNASGAGVPDYFDRLRETTVFDAQAPYRRANFAIDSRGGAQRIAGIRATPSFYAMLNARPLRGLTVVTEMGKQGMMAKSCCRTRAGSANSVATTQLSDAMFI